MKCANGGGSAVYGLGFVGATIYFITHAATFGEGILGIIKALVWPGILVFRAFEILGR